MMRRYFVSSSSFSPIACLDRLLSMSPLRRVPLRLTQHANSSDMTTYQPFVHNYNCQVQCFSFSTRIRRRKRQVGKDIPAAPHVEDDTPDSPVENNSFASPARHSADLSPEEFLAVSTRLLDRVQSAITQLKDCNDGLEVIRYPPSDLAGPNKHGMSHMAEQLSIQIKPSEDLFWGGGTYLLSVHLDRVNSANKRGGFVTLRSPLSGTYTYTWKASTKEWVGDEDGHSLLGMLTRDWIRQCAGVPHF